MAIEVSFGCEEYPWIRPLIEGDVEPTGVDLTVIDGYRSPQYYTRMLDRAEFDMAELSLGAYLATQKHPDEYNISAIPVFPNRRFRHSFLYVRKGAKFDTPADLNGQSIGMINWMFTGGIWARGTLQERHGLDLTTVDWKRSRPEYVPADVPDQYNISTMEEAKSGGNRTIPLLEQALVDGQLDAVITPTAFRHDEVERLFDEPFEVEKQYLQETGIYPIHHLVAIRDDVIEEYPWLPTEMYKACVEAQQAWTEEFTSPGWSKRSPFVWSLKAFEEQFEEFDGSPWEHGLSEQNRANVSQAIQYAHEQGVISERYSVEDLFLDGIGGA